MYSFTSTTRYSELNDEGELTAFSLLNYLQDTAIFHTEEVAGGIGGLYERGYAFYVATWQIHIHKMPEFNSEITTTTWAYNMRGLLVSRAFSIQDNSGNTLVEADSSWFLNDVNTNQPVHVPQDIADAFEDPSIPRPDIGKPFRSIKVKGEGSAAEEVFVGPHYLDTNGHMNNAHYVQIAIEAAGKSAPHDLARIDVQYRSAAVLGDVMLPLVYQEEDGVIVMLNNSQGSPYACVKLYERN